MAVMGHGRVSATGENLDLQLIALHSAVRLVGHGCKDRPRLRRAVGYTRRP